MNEVELKFLEIDVELITKKLLSLGAIKVFDNDLKAVYFDTADGQLAKNDEVLRVRTEGDKVVIAYKQKKPSEFASVSDEKEVIVSDYDQAKEIFLNLRYVIVKEFVKHRISYKLDGFSFEIDTLTGIPTFLEIEASSEADLANVVERLGLDISNGVDWNGFQVREHYESKK